MCFRIGFDASDDVSWESHIIANYQSTIPFSTISFELLARDKSFRM